MRERTQAGPAAGRRTGTEIRKWGIVCGGELQNSRERTQAWPTNEPEPALRAEKESDPTSKNWAARWSGTRETARTNLSEPYRREENEIGNSRFELLCGGEAQNCANEPKADQVAGNT